jgi:2-alkyl-3-oxoalkanoate reductase
MRILVTGGTGFLGQHLAQALLDRGHTVRILGRDFTHTQFLLSQGAEPIQADLRDTPAVLAACQDIEVVYHVAALSSAWGKAADFHDINVLGTRAVLAGCHTYHVRRCIYVSSPSVTFDGHDVIHQTEDAPYPSHFLSPYSFTKKCAEDLIRGTTELETIIIRPKAIFGPGDRSLLPQLIAAARINHLPQIGSGHNLVDLTYVDNVVDALLLALHSTSAVGKTYTITNNEHVPLWDVIKQVLAHLHLSTHLRTIPLPIALAAATLMEGRARVTGTPPLLTRYSAALLACEQTYDISAASSELGYTPLLPISTALERTLGALQQEHTR